MRRHSDLQLADARVLQPRVHAELHAADPSERDRRATRASRHLTYSGTMLDVEQWPTLREPVMLVALTGWVDGGLAGTGTLAAVAEALESPQKFASHRPRRPARPPADPPDGVARRRRDPPDRVAVDRPRRRARRARRHRRRRARAVGPLAGRHRRARRGRAAPRRAARGRRSAGCRRRCRTAARCHVLATASSRSVAQEVGALRADYFGPTGAQTVLQVALGEAGRPRRRALGPGAALRRGHAVAAGDPGAARAAARRRRPHRGPATRSTSRATSTSSGSRRA